MTPEEQQAAKSAVEAALYSFVEPDTADQAALAAEAVREQSMVVPDAPTLVLDNVGKPLLSGA